jgi:hypothetical protein
MGIEGEVLAENGEIVIKGQLDLPAEWPGERLEAGPKDSVVDEEEVCTGRDGLLDHGQV